MPIHATVSEYVPLFLSKFKALCKKKYIQSAYKSGVAGITDHPALMNHVSENSTYWCVLDTAFEHEVLSESFHSLSEVLIDHTIKEVVLNMFGLKNESDEWPYAVKAYAYEHNKYDQEQSY